MTPSEGEIRAQVQRLLAHPDFAATPKRRAFLGYIVEEYLAGRADQIKGVSIAMSVFDRDASFDQQIDPIVRLEARRLRQDIDGYYAGAGRNDPLRLSIPKGGYAPRFEPVPQTQPTSAEPSSEAGRRYGPVVLIGAVVLVLAGLFWGLFHLRDTRAAFNPDMPKGPVVAVLPIETLGDGPAYFADGLTQQLTSELIRFRDIWVLPLGSTRRFASGDIDTQLLRSEFGADFALEGSVMETGDTLRLSARLIDLKDQRYAWVQSYTIGNTSREIYAVQDSVIRDVVGKLAGKYGLLTQEAMRDAIRTPPDSRDAYDCVLGYYSYQINIDLTRHAEVKSCILGALEKSPNYAEAWAVLSNLYLQQIRFRLGGDQTQVLGAAETAARRAVGIDPNLAAGHLMLANVRFARGDIAGFREAGQRAMALNPNDTAILAHYGMRLAFSGDWNEGLAIVDRAIALNPVHPQWYRFPQVFYLFDQGAYPAALTQLDQIDMPNFFWTHLWRAALNAELGNHSDARAALEELLLRRPEFAVEATSVLSIWQLNTEYQRKLIDSLQKAGLQP
ncbi:tetratricopeptide repeat protein [Ruegeria halocynthiae]|uniref:tetratricopeptide repeat protein n=1 Tax=Ruegeria halocynthiae TaxID=985054 RepID=UPI00056329FD|nr:hypothetical protein [Ruegeria halocynthiae]